MTPSEKLINKSKLRLMTERNTTFYSALLANLYLLPSKEFPRAATDGIHLYYNPEYFESLDVDEVLAVLLHETEHVAYEHVGRRLEMGLDPDVWNAAGDFFINNGIDSRGYRLPTNCLIDHQYDGMSTMQIYQKLIQQGFKTPPEFVDLIQAPDGGKSEEEHSETVLTNIIKAVTQARIQNDYGSIPADIARKIEEVLNPKLPWNQIFQNRMTEYAREDYTWSKPNRRFWPEWYLPSMRSEALNQITVAVDVSGSIGQYELDSFMAEINYIWSMLKPVRLRLLGFDTEIHDDTTYEAGESMEDVVLHGGGGTDCGPVIQTVHRDNPEVTIIFTDGEFGMPDFRGLATDLIWIVVANKDFRIPYGEIIHFEE